MIIVAVNGMATGTRYCERPSRSLKRRHCRLAQRMIMKIIYSRRLKKSCGAVLTHCPAVHLHGVKDIRRRWVRSIVAGKTQFVYAALYQQVRIWASWKRQTIFRRVLKVAVVAV